ncbi:PREDICTED: uncharacterized protein LOC108368989, partial [Rhagoletis zephyria]|uniref:uncharacterized protein LOC108368989 n=1 Tax=Rhagoletis zephyria TaxID=28612 RepID=UPI000811597D
RFYTTQGVREIPKTHYLKTKPKLKNSPFLQLCQTHQLESYKSEIGLSHTQQPIENHSALKPINQYTISVMIRSRNSIRNSSQSSNNTNNKFSSDNNTYLGNLYDDTYARYSQSSEHSTNANSLTNSTFSLLEHQKPFERSPCPLVKATAKPKAAASDHSHRQPWRQSKSVAYQPARPAFVTPGSGQKLSYHSKLQYPGAVPLSYVASRPMHGAAKDVDIATKALQTQHQQQLVAGAKFHSTANSVRCMRRPRLWMPTALKRILRAKKRTHNGKVGIWSKGRAFVFEFLQGSSIHGFIYLAKIGLSFVERMIWFAFICVALFAIISLSKRTWVRFQTSPMVISMDRNKLVWNTSFPSLTVCPHKRIDELKVEEYMDTHPETFESVEDREDFRIFIDKLARLTYENIETLPRNKSFGIPGNKYLDLLYELKWNFEPEMSSGAAVQMFIYETLTEFGICHSVNSLVARYNSYEYWKGNDWNFLEHGDRVTVHPLDGEIYAQIINLSTAYDVYFHGAGDIPNISKQRYTFPESDYTTVELIALEIYTAEEARAFTTTQRKCRYQYEAEEMQTAPIYSFGLCLAECRMFFALKVCGCVPHFYRNHFICIALYNENFPQKPVNIANYFAIATIWRQHCGVIL